ncbi:P-II family nitrogen regulator [Aromatoleum toluvorans]|uniref:P-II family nitrogen regulator n=1 Tax=Aromatoleum toluvorans TaxID=92002 RepID=A0ABX1Q221_9RHOO|nr:P-II family nitrogen regulator [Aromatoleum toluvorans]NMG45703.1 P-II family nitrogen regulator [Aromatoleum toluvorans]
MKQITAIFRPQRLEAVEAALHALPRLPGFTLYPARGHARGHGAGHRFVADDWNPDAHDAIVLLVLCSDEDAPGIVTAVSEAARTGHAGDGIVGVVELAEAVRIRSGERDAAAL